MKLHFSFPSFRPDYNLLVVIISVGFSLSLTITDPNALLAQSFNSNGKEIATEITSEPDIALLRRPIELGNQFPIALFHDSLTPTSATLIKPSSGIADLALTISNTFATESGHFINDAETANLSLAFAYGLSEKWELAARLSVIDESGGIFDHLIDQWHNFFGLPRGGRDKSSEDDILLSALQDDGDTAYITDSEIGLSTVHLSLKRSILSVRDNSGFDLALAGVATIPTASSLRFGTLAPDLGLQLLTEVPFDRLSCHAGAGVGWLGDNSTKGYEFERFQFSGFFGSSYAITKNLVVITTLSGYSKLLKNIPGFPDHSAYLDVGARYFLSNSWSLHSLIRENPTHRKGTTDISALIGLTKRF